MRVPLRKKRVMIASPKLAEDYVKIAEMRMKGHKIQNLEMNKQEELRRQTEEK